MVRTGNWPVPKNTIVEAIVDEVEMPDIPLSAYPKGPSSRTSQVRCGSNKARPRTPRSHLYFVDSAGRPVRVGAGKSGTSEPWNA
jgi:hypothetical protein